MTLGRSLSTVVHSSCCLKNQYNSFYRTAMTSLLVPPMSVRGMTCLDRDAFTTVVNIPILKLLSNIAISNVKPILKKYIFKIPKFKSVDTTSNEVIVYLNPNIVKKFEDITENDRNSLAGQYEQFSTKSVTLKYENWSGHEILKAILPEDVQPPTAYSLVGHIMQINLRDIHLPYKTIIGQVFLDKTPSVRTVVNKVNAIDTTFRYFTMEILAGEKNTITITKEHGCTYQFDFARVYWNPRLSNEHTRLAACMKKDDVLYDVFAGVGPFAVPAARKGVRVLANDLNPESYKWLQINATANKIKKNFKAFNMDGRDFLRDVVKNDILSRRARDSHGSEHIIMNLPASAVEFLDILPDWFTQEELGKICLKPPTFHVYCFVKADKLDDVCKLAKLLVEEKIDCTLSHDSLLDLHNVRGVSTNKEMVRVSFLLKESMTKGKEPATKKAKIEEKTMGKNKGNHKNKNVFKVATARSIKLKAKAQKVVTKLKRLDEKGSKTAKKDKTANMDQLLEELRKDIQGSNSKAKLNTAPKKHTKTNKKLLVSKIAPEQTNETTAMVEQMQL